MKSVTEVKEGTDTGQTRKPAGPLGASCPSTWCFLEPSARIELATYVLRMRSKTSSQDRCVRWMPSDQGFCAGARYAWTVVRTVPDPEQVRASSAHVDMRPDVWICNHTQPRRWRLIQGSTRSQIGHVHRPPNPRVSVDRPTRSPLSTAPIGIRSVYHRSRSFASSEIRLSVVSLGVEGTEAVQHAVTGFACPRR